MNTLDKGISHLQGVIAKNVKKRRLQMGLSQEKFADICEYHRTYIGSIERSERNITVSTLEALAAALEVDAAELLRDDG